MVLNVIYVLYPEEDWAVEKCPHGDVLRNEKNNRPVTCSQRIDDDDDKFKSGRTGGRKGWGRGRKQMVSGKWGIYGKRSDTTEKKGNVCPQTHICTMVSKLGISVCCPRNTKGSTRNFKVVSQELFAYMTGTLHNSLTLFLS